MITPGTADKNIYILRALLLMVNTADRALFLKHRETRYRSSSRVRERWRFVGDGFRRQISLPLTIPVFT